MPSFNRLALNTSPPNMTDCPLNEFGAALTCRKVIGLAAGASPASGAVAQPVATRATATAQEENRKDMTQYIKKQDRQVFVIMGPVFPI